GGGMWWGGGPSGGGLFRTSDGGATWTPIDQGLTSTSVTSVWVDPAQPTTLLCATTDGLFRSTTSGSSWTLVLPGAQRAIVALSTTLYVGGDAGLSVSSDGGVTWTTVAGTSQVTALAAGAGEVMAGQFDGSLLVGSGSTFHVVDHATAPPIGWSALAIDPTDPSVAFAAAAGTSQVFRTSDGGATWTPLVIPVSPIIANFWARTIALDPRDPSVVYIGGDEVLDVSTDGGQTFTAEPAGLDIWGLVPDPAAAGTLFAVTDQGLYSVSDQGRTWTSLNGNLTTGLTYSVAVSGSTILAREQDFSIIASFDGGATWQMLTAAGGENGDVVISPANPQDVFGIGTADGLTWSSDGGHTWTSVPSVSTFSPGDQTVAVDPLDPSTVFAATDAGVVATHDTGTTWAPTGWPLTRTDLVAVDPTDAAHVVVGTHDAGAYPTAGALHVTFDGGATWLTVDVGSFPSSVAFLDGALYVGTNAGVLVSHDGGRTFVPDSTGLPALATVVASELWPGVESLAAVTSVTPHLLVASTTEGVYAQVSGQTAWVDISGDLRARFVHQAVDSGGYLYLATYGQGVVRAPLSAIEQALATPPPPSAPVLTGATLQVRALDARGRVVGALASRGALRVTLVPRPAGVPGLVGACVATLRGRRLALRARTRGAHGALTCTWRLPGSATGVVSGWISLRAGALGQRRRFAVRVRSPAR
ncbi:MAG: WD40/YVTN/BNR-like repeat-containing protein, partial [Acidimicrobiales bacterium]